MRIAEFFHLHRFLRLSRAFIIDHKQNPPPMGGGFFSYLIQGLAELAGSGSDQEGGVGEDIANGEVS